tara:strand:+ start:706 stop:1470 length:765 start_codon:yes stop_codon:yes gene_type:complete
MSESHVINDKTASEEVTLEDEAAKIEDQEQPTERPEWLPDKFKSPEDLATAYNNLETRLGTPEEESEEGEDLPPTEASEEAPEDSQADAISSASTEFADKGSLSDDTYTKLAESGLGRELVDSYIAGQEAIQQSGESSLLESVGGREAYDKISDWAADSLSEKQLGAYNQALETGNEEQASLAIDWLKGKYESANGVTPTLSQGKTTGSGVSSFESRAQVMAAMSERDATGRKRYEVDPAYRSEVERRLAISNI